MYAYRYKHRGKGQNHSLGSNVQVKRTLNQEKEAQREGVHTRGTVKRPRIDSAGYALVMSKDEVRFVCVERTEYSHIGEGTAQSLTRSMSKAYDHVMPKGSTRRATKTVEEKEVDIVCSGEAEEPFENHYDVSAVVPHDNRYEVIGEVYDRLIY